MPLDVGDRLGPYEILAPLGAGGMGEVYRARDSKLNRDVAVKVLRAALANDADYLARFQREAQVLAALIHPNIAAIYGLQDQAIVMELVDGQTLADRLAAGALPLSEALPVAKQIAEALEAAHEKGIVHRDLKPGNVKITPDGVVKVLDFGLAKTAEASTANLASSPTLTLRATEAGLIMGTAGYMSPEQAAGKPVDKRADIWSFGVVLYEMLAGKRLFDGETVSHTLADVLRAPIDFGTLPTTTPPAIRELLQRCLDRDVKMRLRDIGDARITLVNPGSRTELPPQAAARPIWFPWTVACIALLVAIVAGAVAWRASQTVDQPLKRFSVDLGPEAVAGTLTTVVLSPDGSRMVFPIRGPDGKRMLATRLLDQTKATPLAGTLNGTEPFFSPDGQWIGFHANAKLKKIAVQGGATVTLGESQLFQGADWGEDGNIIFGSITSLFRLPAAGGVPQLLTKLDHGDRTQRWPQILPAGKAVLFTGNSTNGGFDEANIEAVSLETGEIKILQRGGYFGRYLPTSGRTGHLVYIRNGTLFAVAFDPTRLEVLGTPLPLLDDVAASPLAGAGQFTFSRDQTFVYLSGSAIDETRTMAWLDSTGKTQPLLAKPGNYAFPSLSPDAKRLAYRLATDVWVYDLEQDASTQLTFTQESKVAPIWTPDGKHLAFSGGNRIWWMRADGSEQPQKLMEARNPLVVQSFSPDGRRLAFLQNDPETAWDVWTVPLDLSEADHPKTGKPEPFLRTPSNDWHAVFSPDGRWMAVVTDDSDTREVFVRTFPGPGGKWRISSGGGSFPAWSRNGRELFYLAPDDRIMVVDYTSTAASFTAGKPRVWSNRQILRTGVFRCLELAPDGKRFVVFPRPATAEEPKASVHVTILLNFFDELKRRVPPGHK